MDNFFDGIDLGVGEPMVITGGGPITPEVIEEAFRLMMDKANRATCEGTDGVMRHLVDPKFTSRYCIVCGWDVKGCIRVGDPFAIG